MLDEGAAAAEAVALMRRTSRRAAADAVLLIDADAGLPDAPFFGVLLQYPGDSGRIRDIATIIAAAHERQAVVAVAAELLAATAHAAGCLLRQAGRDHVQIAVDETTTDADLAALAGLLGAHSSGTQSPGTRVPETAQGGSAVVLPTPARTTEYMANAVFHTHNSETQMLRYLRRLSGADYALDRGVIPLGSCTIKLNATTEMATQLEEWLAQITGYDAVSVQPNAGSQGEFAGLTAIRAHHVENGNPDRDIVLIPTSAHGTNAASAIMVPLRQRTACLRRKFPTSAPWSTTPAGRFTWTAPT